MSKVFRETMSTALYEAVQNGKIKNVVYILTQPNTDPVAAGPDGRSPFHVAVHNGDVEIVKLLLQQPAVKPYVALDQLGRTPLHVAAWHGHAPVVEVLLATRPKRMDPGRIEIGSRGSGSIVPSLESSQSVPVKIGTEMGTDANGATVGSSFSKDAPSITQLGAVPNGPVADIAQGIKPEIGLVSAPTPGPYVDVNAKAREKFVEPKGMTSETIAEARAKWAVRGFTPLHLASWEGKEEVVNLLLADPETDLDAQTMEDFTALHMAADRGHDTVVHLILEEHERRKPGRSLQYGVNLGDKRAMKYINHERDSRLLRFQDLEKALQQPGPVNARDCVGRTPLHYAAKQGRVLTVTELLEWNDTHVNAADLDGLLPLHIAAREGHTEVVELLVYEYFWGPVVLKGQIVPLVTKATTAKNLVFPFGLASELLPRPDLSDVTAEVTERSTPLHMAAVQGHSETVVKLLQFLDIAAQNADDQTALDVVIQRLQERKWEDSFRLIEVFKLLLICMPRVNTFSKFDIKFIHTLKLNSESGRENLMWKLDAIRSSTLLHWAASKGSAYLVQLLLRQPGVDINAVGEFESFTPLHCAAKFGHVEVVRLLVEEKNLSANEEDTNGRTAVQIAAEKNETADSWRRTGMKDLLEDKNPLEGIIQINWRDVEKLLTDRSDVRGYLKVLYRDRQLFVEAANAILVGAALIATITYNGWVQPPLGFVSSYHAQFQLGEPAPPDTYLAFAAIEKYNSVRAFWVFNSLSFFFSMASVISGACGVLPVQGKFIKEAVNDAQYSLCYASLLMVIAVVFALGAFTAAGIAVMPTGMKWQKYMTTAGLFGGMVSMYFVVRFMVPIYIMFRSPAFSMKRQTGLKMLSVW